MRSGSCTASSSTEAAQTTPICAMTCRGPAVHCALLQQHSLCKCTEDGLYSPLSHCSCTKQKRWLRLHKARDDDTSCSMSISEFVPGCQHSLQLSNFQTAAVPTFASQTMMLPSRELVCMKPSPPHFTQVTGRVCPERVYMHRRVLASHILAVPSCDAVTNWRQGISTWAGCQAIDMMHFECPANQQSRLSEESLVGLHG